MKAYKTEIRPNKHQIELIHQTFGNTRYVYNQFLQFNFERMKQGLNVISGYEFSKLLNNSSDRPDWLLKSPSKAIKQAILNAHASFWNYLTGKKGKPKFKKKTNDNSFYLIGTIKVERHRIFLPKLKWVRLKEFGYIPKNVKSVTVSMKNGRYYVSCLVHEHKNERIVTTNEGIGIDFGLKDQFITKNETIPSINKSKKIIKLEKKLKRNQRSLSRKYEQNADKVYYKSGKKKGQLKSFKWKRPLYQCKNIQKQCLIVNKLQERITRIRTDYNNKALQSILKQKPCFIVIEDLNVKGLMKNKHLSNAISKAQWYISRLFLLNQCNKLGIELRLAPRFYPSSKLCSNCGYHNKELKLNQRMWTCPNCKIVHNRDRNASINLEQCATYTVLTTV